MTDQHPPAAPNLDQQIRIHELQRRDAERSHDAHKEIMIATNQAAIESGNLALRMVLLINGGAAVSILAFIGGLVSQGKLPFGPQLNRIALSLIWFAGGVAAATLAQGGAYLTNFILTTAASEMEKSWQHPWIQDTPKSTKLIRLAEWFRWLCVALALGSLALFVCGMISIFRAVTKFPAAG